MTTIRCARTYDAPALAELSGVLGYPATRQQIVARLAAIETAPAHKLFVAEDADGRVVGWLHAAQCATLTEDDGAEILGLVVEAPARSRGIGAALLQAAEAWAKARGASYLRVRSRIEREGAHRFYERAGYARSKTQHVFRQPLG
ncbi:MAG TPA: GNAT family N-acetyltransferase [Dokdonella sp.]